MKPSVQLDDVGNEYYLTIQLYIYISCKYPSSPEIKINHCKFGHNLPKYSAPSGAEACVRNVSYWFEIHPINNDAWQSKSNIVNIDLVDTVWLTKH